MAREAKPACPGSGWVLAAVAPGGGAGLVRFLSLAEAVSEGRAPPELDYNGVLFTFDCCQGSFSLAVPCLDSLFSTALHSQPVTPRDSSAHPHTREIQAHKLPLLPLSPSHFLPFGHHQRPHKRPRTELSLPSRQPACSKALIWNQR